LLTSLLHRVVARPWVYDVVQRAVGMKIVRGRVARQIAPYRSARMVLDIGGGTGSARAMWSTETRYICLDIDPQKLSGYRAKNPNALALLADGSNLPILDQSIDAVVCTAVTHHLTDAMLEKMLAESARVLQKNGRMILMDAVWAPRRVMGRALWALDRGSFPRKPETLRQAMARYFELVAFDEVAILHRYVVMVGKPIASSRSV
jgi:ubiquinone/menaquinone biosynthesis C-methylase UbiE